MVSFEIIVKAMPPSLSELKVLPSFCFAFKIPDEVTASNIYMIRSFNLHLGLKVSNIHKETEIVSVKLFTISIGGFVTLVQLNKCKTDPYFLQNFQFTTMFISAFCKICEQNTE